MNNSGKGQEFNLKVRVKNGLHLIVLRNSRHWLNIQTEFLVVSTFH